MSLDDLLDLIEDDEFARIFATFDQPAPIKNPAAFYGEYILSALD